MSADIRLLDTCSSTNDAVAALPDACHGTVVVCRRQTAGRGQRGNTWEAEPGKNLTFSMLLETGMQARRQFELSMLTALAVADCVDAALAQAGCGMRATVKWPNDIYIADSKVCGILIENRLCGATLERTIAGVGLNVNQTVFCSDAPNPVSLAQVCGQTFCLDTLMQQLADRILHRVDGYDGNAEPLRAEYKSRLYRGDGAKYTFRHPDGEVFQAAIADIYADGTMLLDNGRAYAFKEVAYVI